MEVVDTLPEYRSILQNSPVLLRASLSIEMGDARHATPADLEACQQALAKLHNLGVLHGDVVECNILITSKGVALIHSSTARKSDDSSAFEEEMEVLEAELCSDSIRGKPSG